MTTKETKNTTNTNETTESEKNTVKRTNKKTVGLIVGATVTVAAVIISMLCLTSCKDNKPTATADEVIGTSVQTVTQVVTDSQGNTHIEEETKVVEVKQTKPSEKSENETSAAKNDKSNNGNSNQSSNNSNSDAGINKQTNLNNTSNNSQSNKTNNSSNSSNSSSAGQTSKPSSGSSSNNSSSQSKPSSGSGSSSSSSSKPEPTPQPATKDPHEGKTWHEAEYKTEKVWVVDEEACTWQRPIIESHRASICNTCGEEITGVTGEHMKEHMQKGENGSYRIETVDEIVGYETVEEPEVGHWETKTELVREAGWY